VALVPFEIVREPAAMRARAEDLRRDGRRLAVVPTMGALHDGHLSLLRAARARADVVILTIFVNPTQFGPSEDLSRYPRDEAGDLAAARGCGLDLAFCPEAEDMYPPGSQTFVEVRALSQPMCGEKRPGHFTGVATVVSKLFHLTRPHVAFFGQKDFQQLRVLQTMARERFPRVTVVGCPIVREPDGLAMSSRNAYLTSDEHDDALALSRGLRAAQELWQNGERDPERLRGEVREVVASVPRVTLEYVSAADPLTLVELGAPAQRAVVSLAARVGKARLIDNVLLGMDVKDLS